MALKKSQLYSSLWASCDELRGGMDASQYKDYILTLLFMKYVTDKAAADPTFLIDVPEGGSFNDMVTLRGKTNIGEGINTIIARLAEAHLTEYVDEHTGDEGLLSDVVNDKGALVKEDLKSRRKTISDDPEFEDEREALSRVQTLAETVQPLPAER